MSNKKEPAACGLKKTSIGGQALIEGVMMRGPFKTAMAVRHIPTGEIRTEEWETPGQNRPKWQKIPFIRGIFNMVESMRFGYKCLMRSAVMSGMDEEPEKKEDSGSDRVWFSVAAVIGAVLGVVLAVGLFLFLPNLLFKGLQYLFPGIPDWLQSPVAGVVRIVLFLTYISLVSLMKDIRRVFMYHGAEHKSIFCYEAGLPLTVENVKKQSRFHPRCGTSFLVLTLVVSILIGMLNPIHDNQLLRTGIQLLLIPIVVGIGYELIKLAGRKDNLFTRIISAPGLWVQRITTKEPENDMIECAITSLTAVIPEDKEADNW